MKKKSQISQNKREAHTIFCKPYGEEEPELKKTDGEKNMQGWAKRRKGLQNKFEIKNILNIKINKI